MSSKQTILDREMIVQALRYMGEDDLLYLNRMVVERLNLLAQARSTVQLAQFAEGDRVEFSTNDGAIKQGTVIRLCSLPHWQGLGQGTDPSWPGEESFLVLGLDLAAAQRLAQEFGQNALVWAGANAVPRLVLLR